MVLLEWTSNWEGMTNAHQQVSGGAGRGGGVMKVNAQDLWCCANDLDDTAQSALCPSLTIKLQISIGTSCRHFMKKNVLASKHKNIRT